ncbi:MAG: serine hydrolase [Candidatus Dojkabacteria bacterium]|nr:serine hydrolase [Candidatus Dojkabacteria bacterium]
MTVNARDVSHQTFKKELLERLAKEVEETSDVNVHRASRAQEKSALLERVVVPGRETTKNNATFPWQVIIAGVLFLAVGSVVLHLLAKPPVRFIGPGPIAVDTGVFEASSEVSEPALMCTPDPAFVMPEIKAQRYVALFADSFRTAYGRGQDDRVSFASIAKLLGLMVVVEEYDMDERMALREPFDVEGNGIDLAVGEQVSVQDLLGAAVVGSKNDAMMVLAQNFPGGVEAFVGRMNDRADDLGMDSTSVVNPVGYDAPGQYSTPRDIAVLIAAASRYQKLRELMTQETYVVSTGLGRTEVVTTTNSLLGSMEGIVAGKTGYTADAGLSMALYVQGNVSEGDPDIITVVMNADDRYEVTSVLISAVREGYRCH